MKNSKSLWLLGLGVLALGVTLGIFLWARDSYPGCFLTAEEARKRWGTEPFSAERFRTATPADRAPLIWSLLKGPEGKAFFRGSLEEIQNQLGAPDGHFHNRILPAYRIRSPVADGSLEWNLAFATNDNGRVRDAMVWRETCP